MGIVPQNLPSPGVLRASSRTDCCWNSHFPCVPAPCPLPGPRQHFHPSLIAVPSPSLWQSPIQADVLWDESRDPTPPTPWDSTVHSLPSPDFWDFSFSLFFLSPWNFKQWEQEFLIFSWIALLLPSQFYNFFQE